MAGRCFGFHINWQPATGSQMLYTVLLATAVYCDSIYIV